MLQRRRHFGACCETELRNALCDSCRNRFEMLRSLCCFTGKALSGCSLTCAALMLSQRRVSQPSAASMRSMRWSVLTCNDKLTFTVKGKRALAKFSRQTQAGWRRFKTSGKSKYPNWRPILGRDRAHKVVSAPSSDHTLCHKTGLWLVCGWTYKNTWSYMLLNLSVTEGGGSEIT